jgi:hypothetical protein
MIAIRTEGEAVMAGLRAQLAQVGSGGLAARSSSATRAFSAASSSLCLLMTNVPIARHATLRSLVHLVAPLRVADRDERLLRVRHAPQCRPRPERHTR